MLSVINRLIKWNLNSYFTKIEINKRVKPFSDEGIGVVKYQT